MTTHVREVLVVPFALAIMALVPSAALADGVPDEITAASDAVGGALRGTEVLLQVPTTLTRQIPADPHQALINSIETLSGELGFSQYAAGRVLAANLSDAVAGRLANVVGALLECHRVTSAHWDAIGERIEDVARDGDGLDPAGFADIRACAEELWVVTGELDLEMGEASAGGSSGELTTEQTTAPITGGLDVWPVIRLSGEGPDVYLNDYLLIVDEGGNDVYVNNVGSNMVDVNFSPADSEASGLRGTGPARGCQMAIGTPGVGGLANGDCIPTAAVVLDRSGSDTYGVKQSPDIDAQCTREPVIRRMVTGGVGFLGVGILLDSDPGGAASDTYTGKTVSLGSGHVFGVGILHDRGGDDRYTAVRNSQGFSLIDALGVLHDESGDDRYDFYLPKPLDRMAPNETPGAGGVVDDVGACDNRLRFLQGGGNVTGVGLLLDDRGNDDYRGGFSDDFQAPAGQGRGGSQGFGNNGGVGILIDRSGHDSYAIEGKQGAPERGDGRVIGPDPTCTGSTCSGGVFIDR